MLKIIFNLIEHLIRVRLPVMYHSFEGQGEEAVLAAKLQGNQGGEKVQKNN